VSRATGGPWWRHWSSAGGVARGVATREVSRESLRRELIDAAGKVLLMEIHRQGGQLIAEGCLNQAIVQEIVAREKQGANGGAKERPKRSHIIFYAVFFSLLLGPR